MSACHILIVVIMTFDADSWQLHPVVANGSSQLSTTLLWRR